jgi:hypothetical protein
VLQIEQELSQALIDNNSYAFEKHLSDAFVFFPPFGETLNKSQIIEMVKYNSLRMESSERTAYKIKVNGQTAVAAYRSNDVGFSKFVDISGQFEWIDLFEKRSGNWQLVYKRGASIPTIVK